MSLHARRTCLWRWEFLRGSEHCEPHILSRYGPKPLTTMVASDTELVLRQGWILWPTKYHRSIMGMVLTYIWKFKTSSTTISELAWYTRCMCAGWTYLCELPWCLWASSVSCFLLFTLACVLYFEEFLTHDSRGFTIFKERLTEFVGLVKFSAEYLIYRHVWTDWLTDWRTDWLTDWQMEWRINPGWAG